MIPETLRQASIPVEDPTAVAEARRRATALSKALRFDDTAAGRLALGVTEAATNIVKHADSGEIFVRWLDGGNVHGVEVLALDKGPGIPNLGASLRDGHSTAGSPGTGLGALSRQTSRLDVYTRAGGGTVLRFEVWPAGSPQSVAPLGVVCRAKRGEDVSGDDWAFHDERGRKVLFAADGLGHGPDAAAAARAAVAAVRAHASCTAAEVMEAVHAALRPTRGAAGAVAVFPSDAGTCTFCGVGNISARVLSGGPQRSMVSHNGILGHQARKVHEFQYPFPRGALCVMHSDGLGSRWDLAAYPGLEARHPAIIAAMLYRDYWRGRDDVAVLVLRNE